MFTSLVTFEKLFRLGKRKYRAYPWITGYLYWLASKAVTVANVSQKNNFQTIRVARKTATSTTCSPKHFRANGLKQASKLNSRNIMRGGGGVGRRDGTLYCTYILILLWSEERKSKKSKHSLLMAFVKCISMWKDDEKTYQISALWLTKEDLIFINNLVHDSLKMRTFLTKMGKSNFNTFVNQLFSSLSLNKKFVLKLWNGIKHRKKYTCRWRFFNLPSVFCPACPWLCCASQWSPLSGTRIQRKHLKLEETQIFYTCYGYSSAPNYALTFAEICHNKFKKVRGSSKR